jgi:branched-chain amino acid transport system ATP-binding protein
MALLKVTNLTKDFGGLRAVAGLSFELNQGEILGLIGPNGAGKTTAFNLMAGFLPPTAGEVLLLGRSLVGLKPNAVVKRGIARTFQIVKPFRNLAVLENVTLAAFLHESRRASAEAEARLMLEVVGLSGQAERGARQPDARGVEAGAVMVQRPQTRRQDGLPLSLQTAGVHPGIPFPDPWEPPFISSSHRKTL